LDVRLPDVLPGFANIRREFATGVNTAYLPAGMALPVKPSGRYSIEVVLQPKMAV
jgi:hypothetical protein